MKHYGDYTIHTTQMPDTGWEATGKSEIANTVFHSVIRHNEEEDAIRDIKMQIDMHYTSLIQRKFLCIWHSEGFPNSYKDQMQIVDVHFFTEDTWFDNDNRSTIASLEVGKSSDDFDGGLIIVRLPDSFSITNIIIQ